MITDAMREKWKVKLEAIFKAVDEGALKLNLWETGFFENVYYKVMDRGWDLSWKQEKNLTKIYNKLE